MTDISTYDFVVVLYFLLQSCPPLNPKSSIQMGIAVHTFYINSFQASSKGKLQTSTVEDMLMDIADFLYHFCGKGLCPSWLRL